jgi:hypothetical protein
MDLQEERRTVFGSKEEVELRGPAKADYWEARMGLDFVDVRTQVEPQVCLFFPVRIELLELDQSRHAWIKRTHPSTRALLHMLFFALCIVFALLRFCVESE